MYFLTDDERFELAKFVSNKAAGRTKVVACGTFEGSVESKAAFVNRIATVVDAVVVLVCQMAAEAEGDEVWKANVKQLLELTGEVPLGLYEVPAPYHRLLSAETLLWCAQTGRFVFHKDTCCKTGAIADKLTALATLPVGNMHTPRYSPAPARTHARPPACTHISTRTRRQARTHA